MKIVEMDEATAPLSEYARAAKNGGLVVTLRGRPVATLLPVPKGADWESLAVGSHPRFLEIMERSRAAHREQGGISPDEMRRRLRVPPQPKTRRRS